MSTDLKLMYDKMMEKVAEIDEKLDSLGDGKAAGKRTIINQMIEESSDDFTKIVDQFVNQLTNADPRRMVGIYYGLTRGLDKAFSKKAQEFIEETIATMPEPTPLITEDEVKPLQGIRSDLYQKIKTIVGLVEMFDDVSNWPLPAKRTGSKGKRGPRAISFIDWTIDGAPYAKLADVVALYPAAYEKVSSLTAAIKKAEIDLSNPPESFEFMLPDGRVLVGNYNPPTDGDDDDDDVEDED